MSQTVHNGTAGADLFNASNGAATDTTVFRGLGIGDTAVGGAGADRIALSGAGVTANLGGGKDIVITVLNGRSGGPRDSIDGGAGADLLNITLNSGQVTDAVKAELLRLTAYLGSDTRQHFLSDLFHLEMMNVEAANLRIDGTIVDLASVAPPLAITSAATTTVAENTTGIVYQAAGTPGMPGTTLSWSLTGADAARFSIDAATGAVRFKAAPDHEAPADAGQDNSYDVTIIASDGVMTASQAVAISVTEVNEAPGATARTGAVTEDATVKTVIGNFLAGATDPDAGATLTVATVNGATATTVAGTYGDLTWDATTGAYTYTLDNARPATDALGAGQTVTESFSFAVSDGSLSSASQTLAITITGANDAPSATAKTGAVTEDAATNTVTGSFLAGASDPDAGTTLRVTTVNGATATTVAGTYGDLTWDAATGAYTYTLDNARTATNVLRTGQAVTESFSFILSDGSLASTSQTLTITVTGANEVIAPIKLSDIAAGTGGFRIIGENLSDNAGRSVSGVGDVNGDGFADLLVGALQNDAGGNNAGAAYVVFGKAGGTAVDLDTVALGTGGFKIIGEDVSDTAGVSVSAAGDVNGDGRADLLIGAPQHRVSGTLKGAAYVVFGKTSGTAVNLDAVALGTGGFKIPGENSSDSFGWSVSTAGDMNGDGRADLLVGATSNGAGGPSAGAAYVVFGKASGTTVDLKAVALGTGGFKIIGEDQADQAGYAVSAVGDVNGDGRPDLLVGAYDNDAGGSRAGAAYLVFGKANGTAINLDDVALGTGGFKIIGEAADDLAGSAVSAVGDVNGDGRPDLLVGAYPNDAGDENAGATYVVFGKTNGQAVNLNAVAAGTGGFKIIGENAYDFAGRSVSAAGDLNGDGYADLLVGAYQNSAGGGNAGAAYVIFGKANGTPVDLDAVALGTGGFKIVGEKSSDRAGYSVAAAGDVNKDGYADLLVGADFNDGGGSNAGAAYVIYGRADWAL